MYLSDQEGFGILPLIPLAILTAGGVLATVGGVYAYGASTKPRAGDPVAPTLTSEIGEGVGTAAAQIGEGVKWAIVGGAAFLLLMEFSRRK